MRHDRAYCMSLLLLFPVLVLLGCSKSVHLRTDSYYEFTTSNLRAHGMGVVGVGVTPEQSERPDLLTTKLYDSVKLQNSDALWAGPKDFDNACGDGGCDGVLARFAEKGKLEAEDVFVLAGLQTSCRYVILGRILQDDVSYDREDAEEQVDNFPNEPMTITGEDYLTIRELTAEVVVYDLKTGSLVWRSSRQGRQSRAEFHEDLFQEDDGDTFVLIGAIVGFLDWLFGLFGGDGEPTGKELLKYPKPAPQEDIAQDIFDDVADDFAESSD